LRGIGLNPADTTFDQQLQVRRAGLVLIEAVVERVLQIGQLKVLAAAGVFTVQKRAV